MPNPRTKGPVTSNQMETSVPGIFSCGNVSTVFDLVDYVAQTGMTAGSNAARFAQGAIQEQRTSVEILPGENVRLVYPQRYCPDNDLVLFIRPEQPIEKKVKIGLSHLRRRFTRPYARPKSAHAPFSIREKRSTTRKEC